LTSVNHNHICCCPANSSKPRSAICFELFAQIAVQVALVVAKVARFDFPSQWPTLFNDLLAGLQGTAATAAAAAAAGGAAAPAGPSMLVVRRTYFVLHNVLKELSSKRLAADQKAFAEVRWRECQLHL
jgi:hypothetical protein